MINYSKNKHKNGNTSGGKQPSMSLNIYGSKISKNAPDISKEDINLE